MSQRPRNACRGLAELESARAGVGPDAATAAAGPFIDAAKYKYDILNRRGQTLIGTGDVAVRALLGIPSGEKVPDFLTVDASGKFTISEVKASFNGPADAETGEIQLTTAWEYLDAAVPGAKISRLELVVPTGTRLRSPYQVSGDQLVKVNAEGTEIVRIGGNVVHVVEADLAEG